MFEDGVEDSEQFAHGGSERHLGGFTRAAQPQVKALSAGLRRTAVKVAM
jgi:hypothetical protein